MVKIGGRDFVLADIPGLIEGAHEGAGIGDRFLGHIERCVTLIHLIDGTAEDIVTDYETIRGELDAYGGGLADKPELVVLNKTDALDEKTIEKKRKKLEKASGARVLCASGATGKGVDDILYAVLMALAEARAEAAEEARPDDDKVWTP